MERYDLDNHRRVYVDQNARDQKDGQYNDDYEEVDFKTKIKMLMSKLKNVILGIIVFIIVIFIMAYVI